MSLDANYSPELAALDASLPHDSLYLSQVDADISIMDVTSNEPRLTFAPPVSPSLQTATDRQSTLDDVPQAIGVSQTSSMYSSPNDGELVPQKVYTPHTLDDRRRYVEKVQLDEPIMFMRSPEGSGISLQDALSNNFAQLVGSDDLMFENSGPSVSIRLMWPGYTQWSRQIPTRDFCSPPGPITRSKLAKNVAKTIQRFITDMGSRPMEDGADERWRVGPGFIGVDDLVLVALQHVSVGSWQAHVRLRQRRDSPALQD